MYAGIPDKDTRNSQYFKNFNQLSNDISDHTVIQGSHFWGFKTMFGFLFLKLCLVWVKFEITQKKSDFHPKCTPPSLLQYHGY